MRFPPIVAKLAAQVGLDPGVSFDLASYDEVDGRPQDFTREDKRLSAKRGAFYACLL